jgi:hypothetical protein
MRKRITRMEITETAKTFEVLLPWAIQRRLTFLDTELRQQGDEIERLISLQGRYCQEVEKILLKGLIDERFKEYHSIEFEINGLKYDKPSKTGITDAMIQAAKEHPFEDLLETQQKKGNIHCPFHEDKHPSASIKNNKLHCFSCGRTWSPIDFIMEKEGLGFKEAVGRLA